MARAKIHSSSRAEHSIGARRFGGYAFEIMSDDAEIARHVGALFGAFDRVDEIGPDVHAVVILTKTGDDQHRMIIDGELTSTDTVAGRLPGTLVPTLTRRLITDADALGLHAGGVARHGSAVALPAVMESGKSTLTAGLVRAGFSYLTDEAVFLDWETLTVIPFPKPISLDPGSWSLFPELEPETPLLDGHEDGQWQIPPDAIRPGALGAPCPVRYFVFPRYADGATTRLAPLRRAEATVELAKHTFRFNERPRRSLDALAAAVQETDCYRLDIGDLSRAVALVSDLVEDGR
jgi:hypothetical protein